MGKELERDQDEAGTYGAVFTSAKSEVLRIAYDIYGVRDISEGAKANWKDDVDRGRRWE